MKKYVDICYRCAGKMKEIKREDAGDFVRVVLQCEDCKATLAVEIQKGTEGT